MNCWECKHFEAETYHQTGFGTRYSYRCRRKKKHMFEDDHEENCDEYEQGRPQRHTYFIGR